MSISTRTRHRVLTVVAAGALAVPGSALIGGTAYASNDNGSSPHQTTSTPQEASNADYSGHGANQHGPYDSTRDGSPSGNGNGNGAATGKPCAGCVGKADNKNPKGQQPGGSDHNAGYECDRNHGIGRSNPAHTGCTTAPISGGGSEGSGSEGSGSEGTGTEGTGTEGTGTEGTGTEGTGTGTGTTVDGTGTSTSVGTTGGGTPTGTEVEGIEATRGAQSPAKSEVLGERSTRVLASTTLPFTGSHVDELLVSAVLLLVSGVAIVVLGRRREA